ncbi:hypothetical protein GGI21_005438, partial [Coemansia aciculifera]
LTDAQIATAHGQVDTLVQLLVKWTGMGLDSTRCGECWAELLKWAARNMRPARVVVALVSNPDQFTPAVGTLAFEELLGEVQRTPTMAASLAVLGLAYPDSSWAERCMEQVIYVMLSVPNVEERIDEVVDKVQTATAKEEVEDEEEDPWAIDDVPLEDEHLETATEAQSSDAIVAESASLSEAAAVDPEELAQACDTVLSCSSLHLAIMIHGYVSACLASPPLLAALGETLLRSQDRLQHDDCRALLSAPTLARGVKHGIEPVHELFRRTAHTVAEIGMGDTAMGWIYEFLGVPVLYRYLYRRRTVAAWLMHLDRVVLGVEDTVTPMQHDDAVVVEPEAEAEAEAGWGESDVELDDNVDVAASNDRGGLGGACQDLVVEDEEKDAWGVDDVDFDDEDEEDP